MATRTLRVEFVPEDVLDERSPEPQIHDVSVDVPTGTAATSLRDASEPAGVGPAVTGAPEVLENPHVDFPGTWRLIGEGADGAYRYQRAARVADTNDTVAL